MTLLFASIRTFGCIFYIGLGLGFGFDTAGLINIPEHKLYKQQIASKTDKVQGAINACRL